MRRVCLVSSFVVLMTAPVSLMAENNSDARGSQSDQDAVVADTAGTGMNVREKLIKQSTEQPLAKWLSGLVDWQDQWVHFRELERQLESDQDLQEYRVRREANRGTHQDQIKLVDWAKRRGLQHQAHAHAIAALALAPGPHDAALWQRLGLAHNRPLGAAERKHLQRLTSEIDRGNQFWFPRIEQLRHDLKSKSLAKRRQAREELRSISDPFALLALEAVLSRGTLSEAQWMVQAMGNIPSHQAAPFLVRQALHNHWESVRSLAMEQLTEHPPESWVPPLLASMETPLAHHIRLYADHRNILLSQWFGNESQFQKNARLMRGQSIIEPVAVHVEVGRRTGVVSKTVTRDTRQAYDRSPSQTESTAENAAFAQLHAQSAIYSVERANYSVEQWNHKVCHLLRSGTGIELGDDPSEWWSWWNDYNYVIPLEKPLNYQHQFERSYRPKITGYSLNINPSCLVAGTPISTDQGLKAVEQLQRGDLVLAQHPLTGELTYRPVIQTTVRDKANTHRVELKDDAFTATSGHHFWVVGEGWVKTRDLEPGQALHTADGQSEIVAVDSSEPVEAYNLVVADFNTYFVGSSRILSHDVTTPTPLDQQVPGQLLSFQLPVSESR